MKRYVSLLFILAAVAVWADVAEFVKDNTGRVSPVGYNSQLPTGDDSAFGFVDLATNTQDFPPLVATRFDVSTIDVRKLYITAYGGDILLGHGNDLATGTVANGVLIASGTQGYIGGMLGTTTPQIWGLPTGAATVTMRYMGWGNN